MTTIDTRPTLEVQPLSGHIGAEIAGVRLSGDLDEGTVRQIRDALAKWKVVFFRDQDIGPADQVAFGRHFGTVTPAHPLFPGIADHPEIWELGAADGPSAVENRIEYNWHADVTYLPEPPLGSILRAVELPPVGGDTQWANLVTAYETLSPPIRRLVDELTAVHREALQLEYSDLVEPIEPLPDGRGRFSVHPLVRIHPDNGERILFFTPQFVKHFVGLTHRESAKLHDLLSEHVTRPELTVRFRWQPGSVAFWD
ncbi:MAG: TauD/TfdA family dioxygenase, partial [Acidimicrobiia bacterium]